MTKYIHFLFVFAIFLSACNDGNSKKDIEDEEENDIEVIEKKKPSKEKISGMAADICKCLNPMTENMSSDAKKIFKKALANDKPDEYLAIELEKFDGDKKERLTREMNEWSQDLQSTDSDVNKCMAKLGKKYPDKPKDEKKAVKQLISDMEEEENCDIGAAIFRAYFSRGMDQE